LNVPLSQTNSAPVVVGLCLAVRPIDESEDFFREALIDTPIYILLNTSLTVDKILIEGRSKKIDIVLHLNVVSVCQNWKE